MQVLDATIANWRLIVSELDYAAGKPLWFHPGVRARRAACGRDRGLAHSLNLMFYPLLIATQSLPGLRSRAHPGGLGVGIGSKLAIAWLVAFFPIVVNTATDCATLRRSSSIWPPRCVRSFQTFWKIRFPARRCRS